jgi:hypothetical protein
MNIGVQHKSKPLDAGKIRCELHVMGGFLKKF